MRASESAYRARRIAIRITAYSDDVSTPILTVMAPSWVKAVATDAAARNGMNIGNPFWLVVCAKKSA